MFLKNEFGDLFFSISFKVDNFISNKVLVFLGINGISFFYGVLRFAFIFSFDICLFFDFRLVSFVFWFENEVINFYFFSNFMGK